MVSIKESIVSQKLIPVRPSDFKQSISWRALPVLIILSLLVSMIGIVLPAPALAEHEGEQTAEFLPSDTDLYLTVNLDPSEDQLAKFWGVVNNWWQDSDLQDKLDEWMEELSTESEIDIEDDVFPWLGPEIAIGICDLGSNLVSEDDEVPDLAIFIGTMDKSASDSFFKDQVVPNATDETGVSGDYNGIETLYFPGDSVYCAFADEYIVVSFNQSFLEARLDMILSSASSLADDADFQECQAALPERAGMLYCNVDHIWDEVTTSATDDDLPEDILESFDSQIPSCFAASLSFTASGISMSSYCPLPEGATLPSTESDLLQSTKLVPSDALLFVSGQDMDAIWEQIQSLLVDNWASIKADIEESGLPEGMTIDDFASLDTFIDSIEEMIGVDIDDDIFNWMTGEYAFALLPFTNEENGPSKQLFMFEVENTSEVEGHLATIIDGINTMIEQSTPEGETADTLQTSTTSIHGVSATLITNDVITASEEISPGYAFLDVDSTHYLVIGVSTDALTGAIDASQGDIPSLDEAEEYQGVLSQLPETIMSLGYINLTQIFDMAISQNSTEEMSQEEQDDFELIVSLIPLHCAAGFSCNLDDSNDVVVDSAVYLLPPSLVTQSIEEGTTGTIEIAEQTINFTQLDPDVGQCAFSVDVDITNAPDGASIEVTAMKDVDEDITSGFELAATDAGLSILDVAYVIRVDKTNLTTDNVGTATITMKVGKAWADEYGTDNVKVIRVSDGVQEVLPTTFIGYEGDYAVFEGVSEGGLSYFGLAAVSSSGFNWILICGIAAALLFVIALFIVVRRVRSSA